MKRTTSARRDAAGRRPRQLRRRQLRPGRPDGHRFAARSSDQQSLAGRERHGDDSVARPAGHPRDGDRRRRLVCRSGSCRPAATRSPLRPRSSRPPSAPTEVLLGLTVEQNVTLQAAGVAEQVQVVAETPAPIANADRRRQLQARRDRGARDAAARSAGHRAARARPSRRTRRTRASSRSTARFAFDNMFMVNGVDVNDNLFGSPQNLFIEDAIEETQVLTSGITAEYGRFTGGVVNAMTKSGGNIFSRQLPDELLEPELDQADAVRDCANRRSPSRPAVRRPPRLDDLQFMHEGDASAGRSCGTNCGSSPPGG